MSESRLFAPVILVVAVATLVLTAVGCGEPSDANSDSPTLQATQVETLVLKPTSFTDVIEVTGTVEAPDDATLSAQTSGTITTLKERGAQVAAGEAVAIVDAEEAQASVEQAEARYELAQDRFERQKPLYQDSIISPLEFEQVRTERNEARAALNQAKKQLANTRVDAPFAGTIETRFVERGEQVSPGTEVVRVVNTRRVRVTAGVPERYSNDIRRGTPVQIDARRYGAGVRETEVTFAGNTIDPDSRTFTVEATLPNQDGTLKPEMSVRVRVTRAVLDTAVVIPRSAVFRNEAGTTVYVLDRTDSTAFARNRTVTLGSQTGERVVVASGLQTGEEIITVGQNNVSPGTPVDVIAQHTRPVDADPSVSEAPPDPPTAPSK